MKRAIIGVTLLLLSGLVVARYMGYRAHRQPNSLANWKKYIDDKGVYYTIAYSLRG